MKTIILVILATFSLISCSEMMDEEHFHVDSQLKPFVEQVYAEAFKRDIKLSKENVTIVLDNLSGLNNGKTYYESGKIVIDRKFFDYLKYGNASDSAHVQYVIFHEMGHLLLHREHVAENVYSIMTADEAFLYDFSIHKNELLTELFKK